MMKSNQFHEVLRKKAEEQIKKQYVPEPNTINELAEKVPKEMLRKNGGCCVSNKTYENNKEIWRKDRWMWKM